MLRPLSMAPARGAVGGAAGVVIAAAVLATTTMAQGGRTANGRWLWDQGVPGTPDLRLPVRGQAAAQAIVAISPSQVDRLSLRRVISAGTGRRELVLIAAQDATGTPCLSFISGGGGRQFSCLNESVSDSAIIRFVADGGTTLDIVRWVTVVGVVRSDVPRLTVITTGGEERELALNQWRAFGYAPASRPDFPTALRAYGSNGSLMEEFTTSA
jgi:hypothetical protein